MTNEDMMQRAREMFEKITGDYASDYPLLTEAIAAFGQEMFERGRQEAHRTIAEKVQSDVMLYGTGKIRVEHIPAHAAQSSKPEWPSTSEIEKIAKNWEAEDSEGYRDAWQFEAGVEWLIQRMNQNEKGAR